MSDNTPAPEGHDEQMAAAFDQAQANAGAGKEATPAPAANASERPSWLPEKFATPEDMAKSYADLEARMSKGEKPAEAETPAVSQEQAKAAAAEAGIDYDAIASEFMQTGEISAERYTELEGKGIPKAMVDSFVQGQIALANQFRSDVFSSVGGEESYNQMVGWAANNLTAQEIDAFDRAVSGDIDTAKIAVAGLKARYIDAVGQEPKLLGGEGGEGSSDVFRSVAELTAAMKDPRYQSDPAYRADVEEKLGRSKVF